MFYDSDAFMRQSCQTGGHFWIGPWKRAAALFSPSRRIADHGDEFIDPRASGKSAKKSWRAWENRIYNL
jgi:hypothetical protein